MNNTANMVVDDTKTSNKKVAIMCHIDILKVIYLENKDKNIKCTSINISQPHLQYNEISKNWL